MPTETTRKLFTVQDYYRMAEVGGEALSVEVFPDFSIRVDELLG